jgi:ankyrin repeat protein
MNPILDYIESRDLTVIQKIVKSGDLKLLKTADIYGLEIHGRYSLLRLACEYNHWNIAKYLAIKEKERGFIDVDLSGNLLLFNWACIDGCLKMIKYLLSSFDHIKYTPSIWLFKEVYVKGHLDVIDYLIFLGQNCKKIFINHESDFQSLFKRVCRNGDFNFAKYLVSMRYGKIENRIDLPSFNKICDRGHLDVIKLLIALDILPTESKYLLHFTYTNDDVKQWRKLFLPQETRWEYGFEPKSLLRLCTEKLL